MRGGDVFEEEVGDLLETHRHSPVAQDRSAFVQPLQPVAMHVDVPHPDGLGDVIDRDRAGRHFLDGPDRAAFPRQPTAIAAMVVVVGASVEPFEGFLRQGARIRVARRLEDDRAALHRVRRSMRVLRPTGERAPVGRDQGVPATVLLVPHHVAEVSQAVERDFVEPVFSRVAQGQACGAAHLACLELEHSMLRAPPSPAAVEVAVVAPALPIDAPREPDIDHVPARRLPDRSGEGVKHSRAGPGSVRRSA